MRFLAQSYLLFALIAASYLLPGGVANFSLYILCLASLLLAGPTQALASALQLARLQPALAALFIWAACNNAMRATDPATQPVLIAGIGSIVLIAFLFHFARLSQKISIKQIAFLIVAASTICVAINLLIFQWSSQGDRLTFLIGKGRHPNQAASLIGVGILSIGYLLTMTRERMRAALIAAGVLHVLAFGLTVSRGPTIALAAMIAAFTAFLIWKPKSYTPLFCAALLTAGTASVISVLYTDALAALFCNEAAGFCRGAGRADIWEWVIARIADHPLVGSGVNFRFEPEGKTHAHNAFMGLAMHFGLPAAVLFLISLWSALRTALQTSSLTSVYLTSVLGFGLGCMFTDLVQPLSFFDSHFVFLWMPLALLWRENARLHDGNDLAQTTIWSHVKRTIDVLLSLAALPIAALIIAPLCVLIRLDSKGRAIFVQEREGKNGIPFKIYKLRTMTDGMNGEPIITRVGESLRRLRLDELPQFINVLKGDMSIIGPRPHTKFDNDLCEKRLPGFRGRLSVKPGITGLAQAHGFVGPIRTEADLRGRYQMDLDYIETSSFRRDLEILILTGRRIFCLLTGHD